MAFVVDDPLPTIELVSISIFDVGHHLQGSPWATRGRLSRARKAIMKRLFAVLCAMAYLAGSAPVFAASAQRGARVSRPVIVQESHVPQISTNHLNRIPAPLPHPAQPPAINGPLNPNRLPPMGNGIR
jgi:hypothetical protein